MRIAAVIPKPFDVLVLTSISRIARNTSLAIQTHEALKKYGVEIHFAEIDDTHIKQGIRFRLPDSQRVI